MFFSFIITIIVLIVAIQAASGAYTLVPLVGTGSSGYTGDNGPATSAKIAGARSCWVDTDGSMFIPDRTNSVVRKVNPASIITTIGGTGTTTNSATGGAFTSVLLNVPWGIAGDSNFVYVAEATKIWKYNKGTGDAEIYAGSTSAGFAGTGGQATSATFDNLGGIWLTTSGDLYVAERTSNQVRKIATDGIISAVTAKSYGFGGDGGPAVSTSTKLASAYSVYVDTNGVIYIADMNNDRIRYIVSGIINTFAGGGTNTADGFDATDTSFQSPYDVKGDSIGNIYFSDATNNVIRIVDHATNKVRDSTAVRPGGSGFWINQVNSDVYVVSQSQISFLTEITPNPTQNPTLSPTTNPTRSPSQTPTRNPTYSPTAIPTQNPTEIPTQHPTQDPTQTPTQDPTHSPTQSPTEIPTENPTQSPTQDPTRSPTPSPTTESPSATPTFVPSEFPTFPQTALPSATPSIQPSSLPSGQPSTAPTNPTFRPTRFSTVFPTVDVFDVVTVAGTSRVTFVSGLTLNELSISTLLEAFESISDDAKSTTITSTVFVGSVTASAVKRNDHLKAKDHEHIRRAVVPIAQEESVAISSFDIGFSSSYWMGSYPEQSSSEIAALKKARIQQAIELGEFQTTLRELADIREAFQLLNGTSKELMSLSTTINKPSSSNSAPSDSSSSSSESTLSGGDVAGIVVGVMAGCLLLFIFAYLMVKKVRHEKSTMQSVML